MKKTGSLSKYGYHLKEPRAATRRAALNNAMESYGSAYLIHKLSALATYRKRSSTAGGSARSQRAHALANIAYVQRRRNRLSASERAADKKKKHAV